MTAALELRGIAKSFGPHRVLRNVGFSLARGEILGLLGPNGSGKTTTLRIAAGFLAADAGTVRVGAAELDPAAPAARARIGYLPERPPLYDSLTVGRYLRFVAAAKGLPRRERAAAIDRVMDAYDLAHVRDKTIARLSKGYRQRIGLAQASLGTPEVILLDEATNGLDPLQIIEARQFIRAMGRDSAVVFSSHIMQEVEALCDRVVILHEGGMVDVDRARGAAPAAGQVIDLELTGVGAAAAVALLEAVPGVAAVEALESTAEKGGSERVLLRATAAPGADIRAAVARAATEEAALLALKTRAPILEDIFRRTVAAAREAAPGDGHGGGRGGARDGVDDR